MDVKKLVSEMTLEEKAGLCSGLDFWHTKPVERLGVPSCMMSDGPHGLRKQCDTAGDHINDSIRAVCFPAGCATAASFDRALLTELGEAIGEACQAERLSIILGPAVNIKRSPLCGRNFEYFSEDPYLAGETAAAHIHGVQSRNVGVSIKHFACNNQEHRRMSSDSQVDERTLREIYLSAFETAVRRERPWTVMCSYNRVNGVFSAENKWLLSDVLRDEWGFDGFVMTDWGAVCDRVKGIQAGLELEMPSSGGVHDKKIVEAVREGRLDEALLDRACERILTVLDRYLRNAKPDTVWDKEAQHEQAARMAAECMVLLKNDDGVLPLKKDAPAAFIGQFAKTPRFQGGGSSHINTFKTTSAIEAADEAGVPYVYAPGYDLEKDVATDEMIDEAVAAARAAAVAIVFAGLPNAYESEGYDRTHMRMPESQNRLISAVAKANPNTVVVLHNGSPVETPWIGEVKGVLEAYLGGQAVGKATVRLLYGDANPCGRLPETFPIQLEDNPSFLYYGGERNVTEYREGVFVGYRYYDKKKMNVRFPFGYGLSYTSFAYTDLTVDKKEMTDAEMLTVRVKVTNTGARPGKEVVQLYVAPLHGEAIRPVRELRGFEKVELQPGETKTVSFKLEKRAFAYWDTRVHDWYVESGAYGIEIARSSRDVVLSETVRVSSTTTLPRVRYDMNSIFLDIQGDEAAMAAAKPMLEMIGSALVPPNDADVDDVARETVNEEMAMAMLNYMPIRGILSFAGDSVGMEQVQAFIDALNGETDTNERR